MDHIYLFYDVFNSDSKKPLLNSGDLEKTVERLNNIKAGQKFVMENNPDINIDIRLSLGSSLLDYRIHLHGNGNNLYEAASEFMSKAGVPVMINCKRYDLINDKLICFGKKTERKYFGALIGKHVVDII